MNAYPRFFSHYDKEMWDSIAAQQLKLQRCKDCGTFRYPPGACCPNCISTYAEWVAVSGRGKLLAWTTFHRQYLPAYPAPCTSIAVQLEEGPILIANIDQEFVPRLKVDAAVEMIYGLHPDGYTLPRFRLAGDSR
jgi:uncharacterized OB-fold protein